VDVEHVMREIRARIAERHGIDLSQQQIQELAARRLEAILDPRTVKPSLLEQLRKSAGTSTDTTPKEATPAYTFEDSTLYESHNGFLRFVRRLLNPVLKLFFNPNPLILALNAQARLNAEHARREDERDRRQTEWNALHYAILQRVVLEISRSAVDVQSLAARLESVGARVDFNDRRLRTLESDPGSAPPQRATETTWHARPQAASAFPSSQPASGDGSTADTSPEAARRRRRRRRGRRSGLAPEGSPVLEASGHSTLEPDGSAAPEGSTAAADGDTPAHESQGASSHASGNRDLSASPSVAPAGSVTAPVVHDDVPAQPPGSDAPAPSGPGWDPPDR
jgi:hypothetical protein